MGKLIAWEIVSVDGFFAGSHGELDWFVVDREFTECSADMLNHAETLLFGRLTYDLMKAYWPTPAAMKNDPVVAERMNNLPKIVFSRTLKTLAWNGSELRPEIVPEEIVKMKQQSGKDLMILGSAAVLSAFTRLGLMDEYRLIVAPVVLGSGQALFRDIPAKIKLKLLRTRQFQSGNVLLCYGP